ncbi:MAG TPA: LiaF domain-containing protein, partial [Acidimicrobiales bacterium]|nr:LiaF domain-containing protein [Acidimicrobiales bacterium]
EGVLTLDEFSDRAGSVFAAQARADLEMVTADLPEPAPHVGQPAARRTAQRSVVAVMSSITRSGRWRAAEKMTATAVMGELVIDLRGAEIDGDGIDLVATIVMGSCTIIVPEGLDVDLTGFAFMGEKSIRVKGEADLRTGPLVRVRARVVMGELSIISRKRA